MTRSECEARDREIIKFAKTLPPPGRGKTRLIAEHFGLPQHMVRRAILGHEKRTGTKLPFRTDRAHGARRDLHKHGKGFCLICKCLDPDEFVEEYKAGKHCWACNDTGHYISEIMDRRMHGKHKEGEV